MRHHGSLLGGTSTDFAASSERQWNNSLKHSFSHLVEPTTLQIGVSMHKAI